MNIKIDYILKRIQGLKRETINYYVNYSLIIVLFQTHGNHVTKKNTINIIAIRV